MSAHGIPADPTFPTDSEREVWERLLARGGDDWTLLANLRLTDEKKDHELDVVVLMPDVGVLVLEVKGGQVRVEGDDWVTGTGDHRRVIHPVSQARDGKYALRHYIETDPRWKQSSRSRVRFGHAVVTPYTTLADDFATPECPRWMIHGRDDQADLAGRLWDTAARQEGGHRVPTLEDCELITEILRGRNLPQRTMLAEADERESRADRLTVEQATILAVTRLLNRVEVRGGAGSGKTVLAMTQAKQLTRGIHGMPGRRVALLCYSLGLASWFKRSMEGVDRRHRPAFVGTFEDLAAYLGVGEFGTRDNATFWEEDLPRRMADLVADLPRREEVRRRRRRRGAGLRRPVVDADHAVPARRGGGRAVRLQRREPAGVRALRTAAGAAGAARARPQPAQHQADRGDVRAARADADVRARW